jgi:hypothetical protein
LDEPDSEHSLISAVGEAEIHGAQVLFLDAADGLLLLERRLEQGEISG